DLMNTLMSFGQDARWRRYTAEQAKPRPGGLALDVATGTGGIARELAHKGARTLAVDFSSEMMLQGLRQSRVQSPESTVEPGKVTQDSGLWTLDSGQVYFIGGDALELPFATSTFDCVT